jgi:hypothetical protein
VAIGQCAHITAVNGPFHLEKSTSGRSKNGQK